MSALFMVNYVSKKYSMQKPFKDYPYDANISHITLLQNMKQMNKNRIQNPNLLTLCKSFFPVALQL